MREGRPNMEDISKQMKDSARDAAFMASNFGEIDLEKPQKKEVGLEPIPGEDIELDAFKPGDKRFSAGFRGDVFDKATHYKPGLKSGLETMKPGEDRKVIDPNEDYKPSGDVHSGLELDN